VVGIDNVRREKIDAKRGKECNDDDGKGYSNTRL
jgi:hypothetical protein